MAKTASLSSFFFFFKSRKKGDDEVDRRKVGSQKGWSGESDDHKRPQSKQDQHWYKVGDMLEARKSLLEQMHVIESTVVHRS